MRLEEISSTIGIKLINQEPNILLDKEVSGCYIGDLLSNVMAHAQAGNLWLTVQTHSNVVAVASLLNLAAIVFVEGHQPHKDTVEKACSEGLPLFSWTGSAYQLGSKIALCFSDIGSENP